MMNTGSIKELKNLTSTLKNNQVLTDVSTVHTERVTDIGLQREVSTTVVQRMAIIIEFTHM